MWQRGGAREAQREGPCSQLTRTCRALAVPHSSRPQGGCCGGEQRAGAAGSSCERTSPRALTQHVIPGQQLLQQQQRLQAGARALAPLQRAPARPVPLRPTAAPLPRPVLLRAPPCPRPAPHRARCQHEQPVGQPPGRPRIGRAGPGRVAAHGSQQRLLSVLPQQRQQRQRPARHLQALPAAAVGPPRWHAAAARAPVRA